MNGSQKNFSSLPQNYRVIPASLKTHVSRHKKLYFVVMISLETAFLVGFFSTSFLLFTKYMTSEGERKTAARNLVIWEREMVKYPKYPEVYYNAALYAQRAGDRQKALEYTNASLLLNPNFEASKKLQENLLQ